MLYINKLTNNAQQQVTLTGLPNITADMTLRFMPRIKSWIFGISYNDFSLQGLRITTAPNILRQYRNQIPFGIMCVSASGLDPFTINDFASQSSNLYLLDATDVQLVEVGFYS